MTWNGLGTTADGTGDLEKNRPDIRATRTFLIVASHSPRREVIGAMPAAAGHSHTQVM